jgi:uncharacterized protein (TIGR03118 family)
MHPGTSAVSNTDQADTGSVEGDKKMLRTVESKVACGGRALLLATMAAPLLVACNGDGPQGSPVAPAISMSISPTAITLGQSATVTWSSTDATSCSASGSWSGTQPQSGNVAVTPTATGTNTYTLMCTGAGSQTTQHTVSLTVNSVYSNTALVSDMAGVALHQDAHLKNPWGLVAGPVTPFWSSNNHSESSTLYDGTGKVLSLVVALPANASGATFDPTGIVFNGTQDFKVNGSPALFIFSGEGGMLAGWNQASGPTAVITYPAPAVDGGGASYKGLAIASAGGANYLYATDFHNNKIDVFNGMYSRQSWPATAFVDATLPAGYAPYGIRAFPNGPGGATRLYVTYAKQDSSAGDSVSGAGLGLVDVYDTSGAFISHLITTGGWLNAPWGLAMAPPDFGTLSGALLVGNFGDGTINAFDPASGAYWATLSDSRDRPITVSGLWAISFGNDHQNQLHNTLFYTAGVNDEADGVYGRIDLGATPPSL